MQDFSSSFISPKKTDSAENSYEPQSTMDIKKYLTWIVLGIGAFAVGSFVYSWVSRPLIVTVSGVGELSTPANTAAISLTISADDSLPANASAAAKERVGVVMGVLTRQGVPQSDIVESKISVAPSSLSNPSASGYTAQTTIGAKITNLDDLESLTNDLYSAGAYFVSQPIITADNIKELEKQVYNLALEDAKSKVDVIANKNWKLVRKIVSVTLPTSNSTTTVTSKDSALGESGVSTNVFKLTKEAVVTYSLW